MSVTTPATTKVNTLVPGTPEFEQEANRLNAAHRLGRMKIGYPALTKALASAHLNLAAAIIAMDEIDERIEAGEPLHSMNEQVAVNNALNAYGQALADLLRGDA